MKPSNQNLAKISQAIAELSDPNPEHAVYEMHHTGEGMISIKKLEKIVHITRELLFPGFFAGTSISKESKASYIGVYADQIFDLLTEQICAGICFNDSTDDPLKHKQAAQTIAANFIAGLPKMQQILNSDVDALFMGDPAAKSHAEIIYCYPAIRAISNYRMAHLLLNLGVPVIPRIITEMAHSETGIDIHPRAQIGHSFAIDHGTGIVIGSTAIIGNHVKIYQGVTLGAKSFPLDENGQPIKGIARHPIIEDHVVIYAQATILGRVTIGANSTIGGNVWLTHSVNKNSKILQFKAKESTFAHGAGI